MRSIILCGFMGCGKSTVGRLLAAQNGYRFVDMDTYIENEAGCTVSEIFAKEGEEGFRRREHDACIALGNQGSLIVATGGGAVLREDNVKALKQSGIIVWLQVHPETVLARLADDTTRPLLQRDDKEQAVRTLLAQREPLYTRAADVVVDANATAEAVAAAIIAAMNAR